MHELPLEILLLLVGALIYSNTTFASQLLKSEPIFYDLFECGCEVLGLKYSVDHI